MLTVVQFIDVDLLLLLPHSRPNHLPQLGMSPRTVCGLLYGTTSAVDVQADDAWA